MRYTPVVALFVIMSIPWAAVAQRAKRPTPNSRTIGKPQPPPQTPSLPPSSLRMSPEKAFYYFVAMYGLNMVLTERRSSIGVSDIYGESFDSVNYSRAMADEFERGRYRERVKAMIAEHVRKIDFNDKFTFIAQARLGEYSFERHSFPVLKNSFQEYGFCIGPPNPLANPRGCDLLDVTAFRVEDAVNGSDFDWSVAMSEAEASAFVKSRAANPTGRVDRRVAVKVTYSVVNKRAQANPYFGYVYPVFIPFIYSMEAYSDDSLTSKLGAIPKSNPLGAGTAEELRLATIAAKTPAKEIGKYRGYSYCRQPKSDGKIHDPLAPSPPCDQWVRSYTLTDIGVALADEKPGVTTEIERVSFFDSPASTLFRENDSEYWNASANRAELQYGRTEDKSFSVVWKGREGYRSIRFESRQERDRFFTDLSRAFQEWKTKYGPFQFSAGALTIEQRCVISQAFHPCPSSTPSEIEPVSPSPTGAAANANAPRLVFVGKEDFESRGRRFTKYHLSVGNHSDYPDAMFEPAPNLAPCGRNTNASRSWVDIYTGDGKKLYGFCALSSSEGLKGLWFALPEGEDTPDFVYIIITDRKLNTELKSNLVSTSAP
jgi:hypothetical protein